GAGRGAKPAVGYQNRFTASPAAGRRIAPLGGRANESGSTPRWSARRRPVALPRPIAGRWRAASLRPTAGIAAGPVRCARLGGARWIGADRRARFGFRCLRAQNAWATSILQAARGAIGGGAATGRDSSADADRSGGAFGAAQVGRVTVWNSPHVARRLTLGGRRARGAGNPHSQRRGRSRAAVAGSALSARDAHPQSRVSGLDLPGPG